MAAPIGRGALAPSQVVRDDGVGVCELEDRYDLLGGRTILDRGDQCLGVLSCCQALSEGAVLLGATSSANSFSSSVNIFSWGMRPQASAPERHDVHSETGGAHRRPQVRPPTSEARRRARSQRAPRIDPPDILKLVRAQAVEVIMQIDRGVAVGRNELDF